MQGNKPFFFEIDATHLLLLFESNALLSTIIDEASPLRRLHKTENRTLKIVYDSRDIDTLLKEQSETPQFVYIARKGGHFDGHSLAERVLSSGNLFVGNSELLIQYAEQKDYPQEWGEEIAQHPFFIPVNSTEYALKLLLKTASKISDNHFLSIAVTGTNGKTSTTQIIAQLIEKLTNKLTLRMGTLGIQIGNETRPGSHVTTPDYPTFLSCLREAKEKGIKHVIFEATSHGLKENRMGDWRVDIAIFTNLTQDHLDYHHTFDDYRNAKTLLFSEHLKEDGCAIINADHKEWEIFAQKAAGQKRDIIGVGSLANKDNFFKVIKNNFKSARYLSYSENQLTLQGISGIYKFESEKESIAWNSFSSPLLGEFQQENLVCAVAALLSLGYTLAHIVPLLKELQTISGRLEKVESSAQKALPCVIVDHAHSPDALEKSLLSCRALLHKGKGKLFCVFGCGGDRDKTKRPLMGGLAATLADVTVVTSDNPRTEKPQTIIDEILSGIPDKTHVTALVDRKAAIALAIQEAKDHDIVLIAGKGSEKYQIIGTEKYPFSDQEVARLALEHKS